MASLEKFSLVLREQSTPNTGDTAIETIGGASETLPMMFSTLYGAIFFILVIKIIDLSIKASRRNKN